MKEYVRRYWQIDNRKLASGVSFARQITSRPRRFGFRLRYAAQRDVVYLLLLLCFIGESFRIAWLGSTYPLTLAPFGCALLLIVFCTRYIDGVLESGGAALTLLGLLGYPLLIFALQSGGRETVVSGSQFFLSYALWAANGTMLVAAISSPIKQPYNLGRLIFSVLVVFVCFGVLQSVASNVFGDASFLSVWKDHSFNGEHPISRFFRNGMFRPPSFVYEPSMFGRLCVLCIACCLFLGYRSFGAIVIGAVGAMTSMSAGAILFLGTVVAIWLIGYRERPTLTWKVLIAGLIALVLASSFMVNFVINRLSELSSTTYSSGLVRLSAPRLVLEASFRDYPFGAPLGSNVTLTSVSAYFRALSGTETRMTNGIYELLLYTGWFGVALLIGAVVWLGISVAKLNWRLSLIIFVMLSATVVSSSFLAFENTLQLLPVLLAFRIGSHSVAGRRCSTRVTQP